jgi:hypothetical protein
MMSGRGRKRNPASRAAIDCGVEFRWTSNLKCYIKCIAMFQKVDCKASGHFQSQVLYSVIQTKLDGKSPCFNANQKQYKTKNRANCVHAGLRILEPSRLQTVQRTKPVRKDHKGHQGPPHVETVEDTTYHVIDWISRLKAY